jgi:plastocyanin
MITVAFVMAALAAAFSPQPVEAATLNVSITAGGNFSPTTTNATVGDTIIWTNNDSVTRNVSSNDHPSHTLYSPLNLGNVSPSGTLSLTVADVGSYGYHDHIFSGFGGTVVVTAAPVGGTSIAVLSAKVSKPNGGEKINGGTDYQVFWSADGSGILGVRISLSTDGGTTYATTIAAKEFHDGAYLWSVPSALSTKTAKIRVETLGVGDAVLASDESDAVFEIIGVPVVVTPAPVATPTPEPVTAPTPVTPTADPTKTGSYVPATAVAATTSIDVDKGLTVATSAPCLAGSLLKGSQPAVYYCGQNGKRYAFPNEKVFTSWYKDFSGLIIMSDAQLAAVPLGGTVTYRPGVRLVKIKSDPKTYAISRGGLLRWVTSEAIATKLYGTRWNRNVDEVDTSLFTQYAIGDPITQ